MLFLWPGAASTRGLTALWVVARERPVARSLIKNALMRSLAIGRWRVCGYWYSYGRLIELYARSMVMVVPLVSTTVQSGSLAAMINRSVCPGLTR